MQPRRCGSATNNPYKENTAMAGNVPGILPKTALVGSRVIYAPFKFPQKFTDAGTNMGTAINGAVGGVAASMGAAWEALQPRGPAKWFSPMFGKVAEAAQQSEKIGQRTNAIFWSPFSQGMEGVGRALAGPGAALYLSKAGMEPTEDAIKGVLNMKLFQFPGGDGGGAPAPSEPPPVEAPPTPDGGADTGGAGDGGAGGTGGAGDGGASSGGAGDGGASSGGAGDGGADDAGSGGSGDAGGAGNGGIAGNGNTGIVSPALEAAIGH